MRNYNFWANSNLPSDGENVCNPSTNLSPIRGSSPEKSFIFTCNIFKIMRLKNKLGIGRKVYNF